jgi:hypothetical protein
MEQESTRGKDLPQDQEGQAFGYGQSTCSHPGCRCELGTRYLALGSRAYCSGECADGEGCDHEDCRCADVGATAGVGAILQGAVRHLQRNHNHKS